MSRALTPEQVVERLRLHHGDDVTVDLTTYVNTASRCRFVDREYGEWWSTACNVINGHGHPRRAFDVNSPKHRVPIDVVKKRVHDCHGDAVRMIESTYTMVGAKCTFVDELHGQFEATPHNVYRGLRHPDHRIERRKATCRERYGVDHAVQDPAVLRKINKARKDSRVIKHWKTGADLLCTAGWEVAFVDWANYHRIDFDWQIRIEMPDGRKHFIDAFIKDGEFANTWVEIKGWFPENRREKWLWFHGLHPHDSQLWDEKRLNELGILVKRTKPNPRYQSKPDSSPEPKESQENET